MPIDDLRTRHAATRPAACDEAQDLADDDDVDADGGERNPTPARLAEIEAAWIAEAVQRKKDVDEGRDKGIPWEEVRAAVFAPPTPEEIAAMSPRRARR